MFIKTCSFFTPRGQLFFSDLKYKLSIEKKNKMPTKNAPIGSIIIIVPTYDKERNNSIIIINRDLK